MDSLLLSPGPDGITKNDLTINEDLTAECLAIIFNESIRTGQLPLQWKTANITPIHKGGDTTSPNNYRPISLTSIPCKLLEHIILREIYASLSDELTPAEHGFRRGFSCETQLCRTFHNIAKSWDAGDTTHAVVLDFKKAFDKVPHRLLMHKLEYLNVLDGHVMRWVHNFLSGRSQRVMLGGVASEYAHVTSGVPQGSVLGPVLFIIYVNDIPDCVDCSVSMYADDTLVYQVVNNLTEQVRFQQNIMALETWSQEWEMPFNLKKCSCMSFSPTSTRNSSHSALYNLCDHPIEWTAQNKYLGVTLQDNLKFGLHVKDKIKKASQAMGMVRRSLANAPKKCKKQAYVALVRPHLEYASSVWDPYTRGDIYKLEMIQNKAIRFIQNLHGRVSITDARLKTGLCTLEERRAAHRSALFLKITNDPERYTDLCSETERPKRTGGATTRAAAKNIPLSQASSSTVYYQSFIPRAIRELRSSCDWKKNVIS